MILRNQHLMTNNYLLLVSFVRAVSGLLLILFLLIPFNLCADDSDQSETDGPADINVMSVEKGYTMMASRTKLSDLLFALGEVAGFKLKVFDPMSSVKKTWSYEAMPLDQIIANLLRDYSTVMLYEETKNNEQKKLKELWIIENRETDVIESQSMANVSIELKIASAESQVFVSEQQSEITHIENLQGLTSDDVIESLKKTLLTDKNPLVRKRAVKALGDIGGTRVLDALESGLGDRSGEVRAELANSFAGIKHQRSMLALGQILLGSSEVKVRQQAIRALSRQINPAAQSFVQVALQDKNEAVRTVAKETLKSWDELPRED